MADFILEMHDIKKHFPGVQALKGVDFNVHQGEIHALVGQNGAGKSTLLKILAGIYIPEQGSIKVNGTELTKWNPQKIMDMGISFIYQELNLIQSMTVTQNLFIGSESRNALGLTDWKKMRARAKDALARIGVMDIDVNVPIRDLTVAKQQLVAIARALAQNPKLLVLDEPTSRLGFEDSEKLFEILKRMQRENISIIYVSHRLSEIYRIADRVTVLRDGKCIITDQTKAISAHELVKYMVGKDVQKNKFAQVKDHRNLLLQSTHLQGRANNVDLSIYGGEVLGLVGTVGAGKTEFVRMLFGIESLSGGTIEVNGKKLKKITPTEAIANGMALCP
ncbi:MAG TPA: sugar ABC transporter ATP-binding protein, partial [Anaerolineaceae bacterium]|nr:sugar ABC transporter ATP-binding protein [Anaerolineaceae bacterium]